MVDVTIFIEGVQSQNPAAATVDSSIDFRKTFHKLFSQEISPAEFNLKIMPFGSITKAKKMLRYTETHKMTAVLLIDLDAPKEHRNERLSFYQPLDTTKIFFMIQEMEAWILSQPDKIETFGKEQGLIRKRIGEEIRNNPLIKNCHPEQISKPSQKLDTLLRQYFDDIRTRRNRVRKSGKRYSKAKDGPELIGLIELKRLIKDFDEAKRLIDYIQEN